MKQLSPDCTRGDMDRDEYENVLALPVSGREVCNVNVIEQTVNEFLACNVDKLSGEEKDAFFVADMGDIYNKYRTWRRNLPRVKPFYAVKCNDDLAVLALFSKMDIGFDCASKAEIEKVLGLLVSSDRIIYANPCKQMSHLRYAAKRSVSRMTFDNEAELYKVKSIYPTARLVIRILPPDDSKSQCQLGMKFGCDIKQAKKLLELAYELKLNVIGVSFHVGSGCYDATAYSSAVILARAVFDLGEKVGFKFTLLDIGGGFPGQPDAPISFEEICEELVPVLDKHFPVEGNVDLIAEPGRFFVASALTLAVNIISKRKDSRDIQGDCAPTDNDEPSFKYYVNDGVYGSFNCLLFDHATVTPRILDMDMSDCPDMTTYTTSIWGPTCDGLDCIQQVCEMPELECGSWLVFDNMGAYTMSAATTFNGMPLSRCHYIINKKYHNILRGLLTQNQMCQVRMPAHCLARPMPAVGYSDHITSHPVGDI